MSISGNLLEKLEAIAVAGFDGIEIFEQDFIAHDANPREVGDLIRSMWLEITLFQPFRDFEGLPPPLRAKAFDRAERKFDLMQELGTDLVLVCSSCHPQALGGIDRAAADFAELGDRAAFHRSSAKGETASEIEPEGKAAQEIEALWKWLVKQLKA